MFTVYRGTCKQGERRGMKRIVAVAAACALALAAFGKEVVGKVTRVSDGDTITILDAANVQHKIRLHGIDAPEKKQAFGEKAKQHLSSLVFGKGVIIKAQDTDRYGRTVGKVFIDGRDVNLEMLRAGFAWHYKRYDKSAVYAEAESEARQNRRGLWADSNPTKPEDFRRGGQSVASAGAAPRADRTFSGTFSSRDEYHAGSAMPVGSRTPAPVCDKWPDTGYWLSINSNKRHNRNCENYRKTRGYPCRKSEGTPCKKCGG